ncbi:uncharacterized protein PGTG_18060 [Puccinia graminis f. sp. tritici CRL 75-36-700-3]|uniref:Uncharacterized protein n=1 Tax=Puccinia graminis f. sp. tritici (strain CRL 75-36-700-3 / race SCCL) TaxID=418459 RepID=E3L5P1_PUCGT|nr:uncharacterized protein PGTG_18060 [Puccinia graminis f. sp. tritici CRL 75-36-700-3]EFP91866.2 hypothetical protein PGTG_18060 [Puccinia graminis f. sp. tritici CRL 75-36-700-3]
MQMICSGEKPVGYLVMSGKSKSKMYSWNGRSFSSLTGNCTCASLFSRDSNAVRILACKEKPKIDLLAGKVLPFCWDGDSDSQTDSSASTCPKLHKQMYDDEETVQAKLCSGGAEVGILYASGDVLPASGKSDETIQECQCTPDRQSKDLMSYLSCANTVPKLAGAQDPKKIVCVNPLVACQT